jgi:hypothetical protein
MFLRSVKVKFENDYFSTILTRVMPLFVLRIPDDQVRVMVFNATFNNLSVILMFRCSM